MIHAQIKYINNYAWCSTTFTSILILPQCKKCLSVYTCECSSSCMPFSDIILLQSLALLSRASCSINITINFKKKQTLLLYIGNNQTESWSAGR